MPIILSFTSSSNRRKVESDLVIYEATNKGGYIRETEIDNYYRTKINTNKVLTQTEDLNPHKTVNVAIQTDCTAAEIGGFGM